MNAKMHPLGQKGITQMADLLKYFIHQKSPEVTGYKLHASRRLYIVLDKQAREYS